MTAFVVIGGIGLLLIIVSLVFGDLLDGALDLESFDLFDGLVSTPVIGAFLAAFGFGGALLVRAVQLSPFAAAAGGLGAGIVMGGIALTLVRALLNMPTDPTPRTRDLVGSIATVVTRIPADGLGEITVSAAGQRLKLSARSDAPIASGATVVVVDVTSPTSVVVTESGF